MKKPAMKVKGYDAGGSVTYVNRDFDVRPGGTKRAFDKPVDLSPPTEDDAKQAAKAKGGKIVKTVPVSKFAKRGR